jgi:hypothetical protein
MRNQKRKQISDLDVILLPHEYRTRRHTSYLKNTILPHNFALVFCSAYFSNLKMEATCSSGTTADFNGIHGVIARKIVLFTTTVVRTSYPTYKLPIFSSVLIM